MALTLHVEMRGWVGCGGSYCPLGRSGRQEEILVSGVHRADVKALTRSANPAVPSLLLPRNTIDLVL